MSERKVLNKYYPPDFDPSKIPRMKMPRNRQYTVRLMAPFNMRCVTCGEYIYKGKKFNARKEDVEGEDYLGIRIYRFYIKCTRCLQEISFKTDPRNTDYEIEAGATRNFMALKLAEEQAQREEDERKEDEATNPMKLLENRTKQSKQELELLESLEELRDLNRRQRSVDYDSMLSQFDDTELCKQLEKRQEEEDEKFIKSVFGTKRVITEEIVETVNTEIKSEENPAPAQKVARTSSTSKSNLILGSQSNKSKPVIAKKSGLTGLVRLKTHTEKETVEMKATPKAVIETKSTGLFLVGSNEAKPVIAKKSGLTGLVSLKTRIEKETVETKATPKAVIETKSSGLSLVGSYSGSDSDST